MEVLAALRRSRLKYRPRAAQQALQHAQMLDQVVAAHTRLMPRIPEQDRPGTTDYLVELVQLGQVYRNYAYGWISRRDMLRQARVRSRRLDDLRWGRLIAQLAEGD